MSSHDEFDAFEGAARASLSSRAMAARPAPYLDDLNPAQREAVEALEGPVLMLAGAGTGKTKALTSRIVHLLNTGKARPNEILAVTFTNKAAREMKNRVGRMLGHAVEGMPWLGTFHAICVKLLRRHAELVGLKSNFTILDTDDQIRLLKQLIAANNIDEKRWPARMIAGVIDGWKNRAWTPEQVPAGEHLRREDDLVQRLARAAQRPVVAGAAVEVFPGEVGKATLGAGAQVGEGRVVEIEHHGRATLLINLSLGKVHLA